MRWVVAPAAFRRSTSLGTYAAQVISLAAEIGSSFYTAMGEFWVGWSVAVHSQGKEGLAQMQRGLRGTLATGANVIRPTFLAFLAEVYGRLGQVEEGLGALDEAQEAIAAEGVHYSEAEVKRLNGELLALLGEMHQMEAEVCFQQALTIARQQQAKSWELRAATSMARLWQQQRKGQEAHELLAPIYDWFTEGFDTADLQEAKHLLDELSSDSGPPNKVRHDIAGSMAALGEVAP